MVAHSRRTGPPLVVIDADIGTAEVAHTLGCRTVFVQRPAGPVEHLVDTDSGFYTVDFEGDAFTGFVEQVIAPLMPAAVVSLSTAGIRAAAVANALLGTPGTPPTVLERLTARPQPGSGEAGDRKLTVHTLTTNGTHRLLAAVAAGPPATLPSRVTSVDSLAPRASRALHAAVTDFLDAAGLENGPTRVRLLMSDDDAVRIVGADHTPGDEPHTRVIRRLTGVDLTRAALEWPLETHRGESHSHQGEGEL